MSVRKQLIRFSKNLQCRMFYRALADRPFLVSQVDACPSVALGARHEPFFLGSIVLSS